MWASLLAGWRPGMCFLIKPGWDLALQIFLSSIPSRSTIVVGQGYRLKCLLRSQQSFPPFVAGFIVKCRAAGYKKAEIKLRNLYFLCCLPKNCIILLYSPGPIVSDIRLLRSFFSRLCTWSNEISFWECLRIRNASWSEKEALWSRRPKRRLCDHLGDYGESFCASSRKPRVTPAYVQPGGRFWNAGLLLCRCRRKLDWE